MGTWAVIAPHNHSNLTWGPCIIGCRVFVKQAHRNNRCLNTDTVCSSGECQLRHSTVLSIQTGCVQVGKAQASWDTVSCFVAATLRVITTETTKESCEPGVTLAVHVVSNVSIRALDCLISLNMLRCSEGRCVGINKFYDMSSQISVGYQIQFFLPLRTKWPHRLYLKGIS
jgi:hypothetical protein